MGDTINTPSWWDESYDSGWESFKAAFKRDWEQTKADLTGNRAGTDLNQDASDTIQQARGEQGVPKGDRATVANTDDLEDLAEKRAEAAERRDEKLEAVREAEHEAAEARVEGKQRKAERKADKADDKRKEAQEATSDIRRFEQAQKAARFGYGARQHYDESDWDKSESKLREDWNKTYPDTSYAHVRPFIHSGWNYGI